MINFFRQEPPETKKKIFPFIFIPMIFWSRSDGCSLLIPLCTRKFSVELVKIVYNITDKPQTQ